MHLVKALFSDAPALFSGRFYNVHELDGWPKPPAAPPNPDDRRRARPRLPRFAAREADIGGFDSGADPFSWSFDALRRQAEIVHEAAGAPPELHLNQTSAAWGGRANEFVDQTARQLGVSPDDLDRSAYVLAGSVHQIVDHLGRLRETVGISYVTSPVDWDDPNLDFARHSTSGVIGTRQRPALHWAHSFGRQSSTTWRAHTTISPKPKTPCSHFRSRAHASRYVARVLLEPLAEAATLCF